MRFGFVHSICPLHHDLRSSFSAGQRCEWPKKRFHPAEAASPIYGRPSVSVPCFATLARLWAMMCYECVIGRQSNDEKYSSYFKVSALIFLFSMEKTTVTYIEYINDMFSLEDVFSELLPFVWSHQEKQKSQCISTGKGHKAFEISSSLCRSSCWKRHFCISIVFLTYRLVTIQCRTISLYNAIISGAESNLS